MKLLLYKVLDLAATLLLGGLLGATLVRMSPGWGVDERELDTRSSEASIRWMREQNNQSQTVLRYYSSYLGGLVTGELGTSRASQQPVRSIIAERAPVTLRIAGIGYVAAWLSALVLALAVASSRSTLLMTGAATSSGLLLSIPAACLGFVALWMGIGTEWAVAAALFPKVFRYAVELLRGVYGQPHVLMAMARGVPALRILMAHVLRPVLGDLLALAGATVGLAFGAAVPLEVICDSAGLGQLAWQAATARDLPVLVSLTLLVTLVVKSSTIFADLLRNSLRESSL